MGRGLGFTPSEDDFLEKNGENKTAKELLDLHDELRKDMIWPKRTLKSLARRVERLREIGKLGVRDEETIRKAYISRGPVRSE